jgi:Thioesterase superfamily
MHAPVSHPRARAFRFDLRVYWEDTDAGGVVFYANYLKFFERARTEWLRSLGHQQERLRVETGAVFVVTDTAVRYGRGAARRPRADDDRPAGVALRPRWRRVAGRRHHPHRLCRRRNLQAAAHSAFDRANTDPMTTLPLHRRGRAEELT